MGAVVNRYVVQEHMFRDGLYIPAGTEIHTPSYSPATDPKVYASPMTFDPQQFLKLRQQNPDAGKHYQFGTVTAENLAFGIGIQACPGRFVAASELKLLFIKLVTGWEVKWGNNGPAKRPEYKYSKSAMPTPKVPTDFRMLVRKKDERDPEISQDL